MTASTCRSLFNVKSCTIHTHVHVYTCTCTCIDSDTVHTCTGDDFLENIHTVGTTVANKVHNEKQPCSTMLVGPLKYSLACGCHFAIALMNKHTNRYPHCEQLHVSPVTYMYYTVVAEKCIYRTCTCTYMCTCTYLYVVMHGYVG